jgi:hypothetical protein
METVTENVHSSRSFKRVRHLADGGYPKVSRGSGETGDWKWCLGRIPAHGRRSSLKN